MMDNAFIRTIIPIRKQRLPLMVVLYGVRVDSIAVVLWCDEAALGVVVCARLVVSAVPVPTHMNTGERLVIVLSLYRCTHTSIHTILSYINILYIVHFFQNYIPKHERLIKIINVFTQWSLYIYTHINACKFSINLMQFTYLHTHTTTQTLNL